ncbi:hypothetical protein [Chitinophaga flava]|uniref:BZIP transcription factor n=1 Tax=Chitinophaga flava TaxID=2259036 RepID=A0A365XP49_9BACT|nr:hypothetical protein [Chitinophaga flava]RBL88123.1 hypothetical protein DF182_31885 [Chitinophaga flava]
MPKKLAFLVLPALTLTFLQTEAQTPTLQEVTKQGNVSQRDGENIIFKNVTLNGENYLRWYNSDGSAQAYIGYGSAYNRNFYIDNGNLGGIYLQGRTLINNAADDGVSMLQIKGPVYSNGNFHTVKTSGYWASGSNNYAIGWYTPNNDFRIRTATLDRFTIDNNGQTGIGTITPASQLHLASDQHHALTISRANGTYGFRIYRNASTGTISFQIGISATPVWETKMQIGEGEGPNTSLLLNPTGGKVGIGTTTPQATLAVNGDLFAKKVKVTLDGWPDYVFDPSYSLPSLGQLENFIKEHKHLPEIPSAKEVSEQGLDLGQNQANLLRKIEELTLYMIDQHKKMEAQQQLILNQQELLQEQSKQLKALENKLSGVK